MKKKALVLAVGLAFATPTITTAKMLPSNLIGLSLGEIQSQSYLNEPFKGIIPILFTDIEASSKLNVKLAPTSIYQNIGVEKLPILNDLKFHVDVINNKPAIYIESTQAIQMPFLNFVLEIEGPQGSIYQDYTTLLDPKIEANNRNVVSTITVNEKAPDQEIQQVQQPLFSSSSSLLGINRTLKVKSGDTLSQIAHALSAADVSLKKMINAIHQRNPDAFINNNINRLKAGATLHIPTKSELLSTNFEVAAKTALKNKPSNFNNVTSDAQSYIIKSGDTLTNIIKKFGHKGVSFTKMMKAIHTANPQAFSKNNINLLKVGQILKIPTIKEVMSKNASPKLEVINNNTKEVSDYASEFVLNGFVVEKGDTLATITKQIGHAGIPYSEMMHAIYVANTDAFEKNNITTLIEGSIIRLPSIAEINQMNSKEAELSPNKRKEYSHDSNPLTQPTDEKKGHINEKPTSGAALNSLEKRVRELKRDLKKAHSKLTSLEQSVADKEKLLKKQSQDLAALANTLKLFNDNASKLVTLDHNKDNDSQVANLKLSSIETISSPHISQDNPIPPEINQTLPIDIKNKLAEYSEYMSGKELLYVILALLFTLTLVRYRRTIYSYANISYDHPKYYPPFSNEDARELLKVKSINFQDTLTDPMSNIQNEEQSTFSDSQIKECENLADELIKDLELNTPNADWDKLDKACDDYIEEFKEQNTLNMRTVSDATPESMAPDSEEMTFELFEALAEGVNKKNYKPD